MVQAIIGATSAFPPDAVKAVVNQLASPGVFFALGAGVFIAMIGFHRRWTKPSVFAGILVAFCILYFGSIADTNFAAIVTTPDNVPVTMLIVGVMVFLWIAFRRAAINDVRIGRGSPRLEEIEKQEISVWPEVIYVELIVILLATAALIVWAVLVQAPLGQPANTGAPPNPIRAPWYFVGVQEMLVYFDPWIVCAVIPSLIVFGLLALPYLDTYPKGNGYYTFRERRFAITTFLFGFLLLGVMPLIYGTFFRGPNGAAFGPYEYRDAHRLNAPATLNLSDAFWRSMLHRDVPMHWLARESPGVLLLGLYFAVLPVVLSKTLFRRMRWQMGAMRCTLMILLLLCMALIPMKMMPQWLFGVKYFIYLPEFGANV